MKSVIYHSGIKQTPNLHGLAEKATNRLKEIVGEYGQQTEAEWDAAEDQSKKERLVTLTLRDLSEEACGTFAAEELEDPLMLGFRLRAVWRALLRDRSDRLLREFQSDRTPGDN